MAPVPSTLLQLPPEILWGIPPYLSNRDIKSLRLTCKALCAISQLRLDRVFLSANPRNIEVLRAVADHEVLREGVVEIIWDDARLKKGLIQRRSHDPQSRYYDPTLNEEFDIIDELDDDDELGYDTNDEYENQDSDEDSDDEEQHPRWFDLGCRQSLQNMKNHKGPNMYRPDQVVRAELAANVSLRKRSWRYYQELIRQQKEVLATNADEAAFKYGLQHFPALRRVTISPAAHGFLFMPLYETLMIRAFPRSFNYPIPRTWPIEKYEQKLWERTPESDKDTWRAFRIATRTLAAAGTNASQSVQQEQQQQQQQQQKPGITEIIVDVNQLLTGLNAHMFDEECAEQRDLATALRQPNFRRLDLALAVGGLEHYGWRAFRSGCLRRTLASAPTLEHVKLTTDMANDPDMDYNGIPGSGLDHHFIPLRDIFPIDVWSRLSHFALSRFHVRQDDLLSFLGALPPTLRSVELSFLFFLDGYYRDLLDGMRDQLGWRERPAEQRPRVSIGLPKYGLGKLTRVVWGDVPVEQFLYHHGPNPFGTDRGARNQIPQGAGGVVRDSFDPAFEQPWVLPDESRRLGYVETSW
ncbi:hypothetical protein J7T55_005754 [Diaporthe amygdali]|uniref:uncharacterized protein n=1 Tax=Phomopsis amygdali TaxID=1214568 RepID=UPI0022FED3E2|nr:uncharacterized protein J7T55_005754 [Diaporthe amygdali]KAJ0124416.1 hypothetical protein J7T55_005754 [Diaporthe amygdali]